MRKVVSLLVLVTLLVTSCASKKKIAADAITKIEYSAVTRGSSKGITFEKYSFTGTSSRQGGDINVGKGPISEEYWNELSVIANKLDLGNLDKIKPPSTKHQYDAAFGAHITITTTTNTHQTLTFDHGNPPEELKPLIEKMAEISGVVN
ncbi:MAG: hypothetical protein BM557_11220 [Flavobacterium sp. MedPE-SWcel]|uniref:hypothetical protein n=1 Tax=uncultured Flavobacterium sp. TaxID=165435 RepID=UPI00091F910B|nr:hypothetical protein [uncultured Flavobacterium sp.]OIQ15614.1 MAG: hypothetical protein BM557_11220 [Flavobacterium sp. MedPE-SWcel]